VTAVAVTTRVETFMSLLLLALEKLNCVLHEFNG